jgi:hypothetical protein
VDAWKHATSYWEGAPTALYVFPPVPPVEMVPDELSRPGSLNTEPGELAAPVLGSVLVVSKFWHVWLGGPVPDGLRVAIAAGAVAAANAADVTRIASFRTRTSLGRCTFE